MNQMFFPIRAARHNAQPRNAISTSTSKMRNPANVLMWAMSKVLMGENESYIRIIGNQYGRKKQIRMYSKNI